MSVTSLAALAAIIDHTILRPDATEADVERFCAEAMQWNFAAVCVNPLHVPRAAAALRGSAVKACSVVGFPLGFQDCLHHLPVVRQAAIASSFGLRFQGQGYFLTDARTHRGTSGAPVVMRAAKEASSPGELPWLLLGIHSARLDVGTRDLVLDEALGLNCAWYTDVLMALTACPTR